MIAKNQDSEKKAQRNTCPSKTNEYVYDFLNKNTVLTCVKQKLEGHTLDANSYTSRIFAQKSVLTLHVIYNLCVHLKSLLHKIISSKCTQLHTAAATLLASPEFGKTSWCSFYSNI